MNKAPIIDPKKVHGALHSYSEEGQSYLLNSYIPARVYCSTERFALFSRRIENWGYIKKHLDDRLFGVYELRFNHSAVPCYIGSSIKPYARFCVELFTMLCEPKSWGLTYTDLEKISISIKVLPNRYFRENERHAAELAIIRDRQPLLNDTFSGNMIEPAKRRVALKNAGVV